MFLNKSAPSKKLRVISCSISGTYGLTLTELVTVIIWYYASIAYGTFQIYTKKVYKIILLHDLKEFVNAKNNLPNFFFFD
jgi:hypothetical protein